LIGDDDVEVHRFEERDGFYDALGGMDTPCGAGEVAQ
jgi:hypothetical protein